DGRLDVATAGRDNLFPTGGAVSVLLNNCTACKPTISCVSNQTRSVNTGLCSYIVTGSEFDPTAIGGNCSASTIKNNYNNKSTLAGAVFPKGTTTIVWTVTDAAGNTNSCTYTVTVNSNLAVSCTNNNSVLYFGYAGDQTVTVTGTPSGGTGPYNVSITMNRPLMC